MKTLTSPSVAAGILVLAVVAWGCQAGVDVEADLAPASFEERLSSLTQAPDGSLYAVASRGLSPTPWVVIEHDGRRHLFRSAEKRQRSARLLAMGPRDTRWIDDAVEAGVRPQFLEADELPSLELDDPLAWWEESEDSTVVNLGTFPGETQRVVAIDPHRSDLLGAMEGGKMVEEGESLSAPNDDMSSMLLIPDGAVEGWGPRVGLDRSLGAGGDSANVEDWQVQELDIQGVSNDLEMREFAIEQGVHLLIMDDGDHIRVGFASDETTLEVGSSGLPAALGESGFSISREVWESDQGQGQVLETVDHLYGGHYLNAFLVLRELDERWSVASNRRATELRGLDLLAAGGLADWHHHQLLGESRSMDADEARFLMRVAAYESDAEGVDYMGRIALELYGQREGAPNYLGRAHTHRWAASFLQGHDGASDDELHDEDERARSHLEQARDLFRLAGEPTRGLLVERQRQLLSADLDLSSVIAGLREEGALQQASMTPLLAALAHLKRGEAPRAQRHLELFADEYAQDAGAAAMHLFRALDTAWRVAAERSVDAGELHDGFVGALERRDHDVASLLALIIHHRFMGVFSPESLNPGLLEAAREGRRRGVLRTWLSPSQGATIAFYCAETIVDEPPRWLIDRCQGADAAGLQDQWGAILERAYGALISDERELAEALNRLFDDRISSHEGGSQPRLADGVVLELLLYQIAFDGDADVGPVLLHRLSDIATEDRYRWLLEQSEMMERRGMMDLAIELQRQAVEMADDGFGHTERFEDVQRLAELYIYGHRWDELLALERPESPLHAVTVAIYQAHAAWMLDEFDKARELNDLAMRESSEFGALSRLAADEKLARLALDRGDIDRAVEAIGRGWNTLSVIELHMDRPEVAYYRGLLGVSRARLLLFFGHDDEGKAQLQEALDSAGSLEWSYQRRFYWMLVDGAASIVDGDELNELIPHWRSDTERISHGPDDIYRARWLRFSSRLAHHLGEELAPGRHLD